MAEHLSPLALDELAAGLPNAEASAHLEACGACRARLDELQRAHQAFRALPEFRSRLEEVDRRADSALRPAAVLPFRRRWGRAVAVAGALAAVLALGLLLPRGGETRLKGVASVELLNRRGEAVASARPGEVLTLAVGGAGHTHAAVLAVDAEGRVTPVWPTGAHSAPIGRGPRVPLEPPLEVTPGAVTLVAFFGDAPAAVEAMKRALEAEVAAVVRVGRSPLDVAAPPVAQASARLRLAVEP